MRDPSGLIILVLVCSACTTKPSSTDDEDASAASADWDSGTHHAGQQDGGSWDGGGTDAALQADAGGGAIVTVEFAEAYGQIAEAAGRATVRVVLSGSASNPVEVDVAITGGTAYGAVGCERLDAPTLYGSGRDYTPGAGTLIIPVGSTTADFTLDVHDDAVAETDESITIALTAARGATMGSRRAYVLTLQDNDRAVLIDVVADEHAAGDGVTDDTEAIQAALNRARDSGAGVVVFPPRTFLVTQLRTTGGVTLEGYGATLKRPANQDKWARLLTGNYSGTADSAPLVIKGVTMDGNSANQGAYQNWELEQQHLVFLMAQADSPGRLRAFVEDCTFINGVADGISVYTNTDATVWHCQATDVFRGGFVLTGGNTKAQVCDVTTGKGPRGDDTGIDIEVDGDGYQGSFLVDIRLDHLNLVDGDFDIAVRAGSTVVADRVVAQAPFYLYMPGSSVNITRSTLGMGVADGYMNRIVCPHDLRIADSEVFVTRKVSSEGGDTFTAADLWWSHDACGGTQTGQRVLFTNVTFRADSAFQPSDEVYLFLGGWDSSQNDNILTVEGGRITAGDFPDGLRMTGGGHWVFTNVELDAPMRVTRGAETITLQPVNGQLDMEIVRPQ